MAARNTNVDLKWLRSLPENVECFLATLQESAVPGFFHYSLSGDVLPPHQRWGLGNTVFAVKSYATLRRLSTLPAKQRQEMHTFILSFRKADGTITDPLVRHKSFWYEKVKAVLRKDLSNFWHAQTVRAETRQALTALRLLGDDVPTPRSFVPHTSADVEQYLRRLDWHHPWGAGSHFSHLLSFLYYSDVPNRQELITHAIDWVNQLQHESDGAWYRGSPSIQQKINGVMKICTGLRVVGHTDITYGQHLIDLCLSASQDTHACDNFNVVYALHHALAAAPGYRTDAVRDFFTDRLRMYRRYYWPDYGGFSSIIGKANTRYYGALITTGKPEPDIHGTSMFLWGLSILEQHLLTPAQRRLQELVP